jgi:hypothetical protein
MTWEKTIVAAAGEERIVGSAKYSEDIIYFVLEETVNGGLDARIFKFNTETDTYTTLDYALSAPLKIASPRRLAVDSVNDNLYVHGTVRSPFPSENAIVKIDLSTFTFDTSIIPNDQIHLVAQRQPASIIMSNANDILLFGTEDAAADVWPYVSEIQLSTFTNTRAVQLNNAAQVYRNSDLWQCAIHSDTTAFFVGRNDHSQLQRLYKFDIATFTMTDMLQLSIYCTNFFEFGNHAMFIHGNDLYVSGKESSGSTGKAAIAKVDLVSFTETATIETTDTFNFRCAIWDTNTGDSWWADDGTTLLNDTPARIHKVRPSPFEFTGDVLTLNNVNEQFLYCGELVTKITNP